MIPYVKYILHKVRLSVHQEVFMSYQERRAIVSFVSTALIAMIYAAIMVQRYPAGDAYSADVFRFWGAFILILIPVSIIAKILVTIGFSIVNTIATREEDQEVMDERDKLIELRATRNSQYVFGIGVVLAMSALVIDQTPSVMFALLFCAGVVSELVSEASTFFIYRRGF